ncbi:MAG TPA: MFS transporter, partial [Spirochaetes bacterium]|nr:MFS transporter [Spirochaetota bacterium]
QHPDGEVVESPLPVEARGLSLGEFVKTPSFWLLALMIFFINTLNMGIQQHLIPYLTDLGYTSTFAANIMGLYLGMTVVGKLSLGHISDTRGLSAGMWSFTVILAAGIAMLFGAGWAVLAVMFALVYGTGNAIQTVLPPLMTARCAGIKHYAVIYGILSIFSTLGSAIGMPLSGYLYDWKGNYDMAFAIYIVLAVAGMIMGMGALKRSKYET